MNKKDLPAIIGLCTAFGSPLVICLGLFVQLVPKLSGELRILTIISLLTGIVLSLLGFVYSFKQQPDDIPQKESTK